MPGCLMSYIPYDTVIGGIEDVVEGNGQLYHTETAGKVAGVVCQFLNDCLTEFLADVREF